MVDRGPDISLFHGADDQAIAGDAPLHAAAFQLLLDARLDLDLALELRDVDRERSIGEYSRRKRAREHTEREPYANSFHCFSRVPRNGTPHDAIPPRRKLGAGFGR